MTRGGRSFARLRSDDAPHGHASWPERGFFLTVLITARRRVRVGVSVGTLRGPRRWVRAAVGSWGTHCALASRRRRPNPSIGAPRIAQSRTHGRTVVRFARYGAAKRTALRQAREALCEMPAPRGQTAQPNCPTPGLCAFRRDPGRPAPMGHRAPHPSGFPKCPPRPPSPPPTPVVNAVPQSKPSPTTRSPT